MTKAVIASYVRSPFTPAFKGELARVRPDEIAGQVIAGLIQKAGVDGNHVEDLITGCAFPEGEQGLNVSRLIGFLADLPITTAAQTVNRFCGSSMQSIHIAAGNIMCGAGEVFIAAGIESMSRIPMSGFNPLPHPGLFETYPQAYESMGITAENVAEKYKIKRKAQDEFAVLSHQKSSKAQEKGYFDDEIIPINDGDRVIEKDGCIRANTSLEALADLKPAFDAKGSVTAGTSSPLTDGASAVLVCSEDYADKNGLNKIARIRSFAVAGCAPEIMGMGPVHASKKALDRAGLKIKDMDVIELNEAFAAQALAVIGELGIETERLNLDGGAISIGHPLGASGARITGKAATLLKRQRGKYALATMCIGGGQGIATVLEAIK
ncbi:thiolase family protein [Rickettsiales bacterium]|nr:thiolase family protein [Rickettsiales bacterium]